jgi:hypothetical protein
MVKQKSITAAYQKFTATYFACIKYSAISAISVLGLCKVNTIPILMHQMRISTNEVSSVVLEPKKLEVEKK